MMAIKYAYVRRILYRSLTIVSYFVFFIVLPGDVGSRGKFRRVKEVGKRGGEERLKTLKTSGVGTVGYRKFLLYTGALQLQQNRE